MSTKEQFSTPGMSNYSILFSRIFFQSTYMNNKVECYPSFATTYAIIVPEKATFVFGFQS